MNNFCSNCGTIIPEGNAVCPNCGAPAPVAEQPASNGVSAKKGLIMIVAGVLAVVLVVVLLVSVFSGGGAKGVVNDYLKITNETADGEKYLECFPEDYVKDYLKKMDMDRDDAVKEITKRYEDDIDDQEDEYDSYKDSWSVKKVQDLLEDDYDDLKDSLEENYDIEIEDAKDVTVAFTAKIKENGQKYVDYGMSTITVIKVDGEWCMHPDYCYIPYPED